MTWSRQLLKSKGKALAIHLGVSVLLFAPFLYLIWYHWFPPPFFFTDGGWQGVRIMLLVDLCIGPTLTFLVFNPAKSRRELTFDYSFIALVQAAALVYGYISVESQRIMAVAFHDGHFIAATKTSFAKQKIEPDGWTKFGEGPPHWVYVRPPKDSQEQAGVFAFAFSDRVGPESLHFLYEPLSAHRSDLEQRALPGTDPAWQNPALRELLHGKPVDEIRLYPLDGYYRLATIALDREGRYVGAIYGGAAPLK